MQKQWKFQIHFHIEYYCSVHDIPVLYYGRIRSKHNDREDNQNWKVNPVGWVGRNLLAEEQPQRKNNNKLQGMEKQDLFVLQ